MDRTEFAMCSSDSACLSTYRPVIDHSSSNQLCFDKRSSHNKNNLYFRKGGGAFSAFSACYLSLAHLLVTFFFRSVLLISSFDSLGFV